MHIKIFFLLVLMVCMVCSCLLKNNSIVINNKKEYFVISIQDEYKNNIKDEIKFYCLTYTSEEKLKEILNSDYFSQYSFYDTLCSKTNAKCILTYWEKYWPNFCDKAKLNMSHFSLKDSISNSIIIKELKNSSNYFYQHLVFKKNNLNIGQRIGIGKVKSLQYCQIFETSFCDLPSDTVVILKNGFTMIKQRL